MTSVTWRPKLLYFFYRVDKDELNIIYYMLCALPIQTSLWKSEFSAKIKKRLNEFIVWEYSINFHSPFSGSNIWLSPPPQWSTIDIVKIKLTWKSMAKPMLSKDLIPLLGPSHQGLPTEPKDPIPQDIFTPNSQKNKNWSSPRSPKSLTLFTEDPEETLWK